MSAQSLEGKVAFVTGAARGIGRAIALALAESGADVAVTDLHPAAAFITATAIPCDGGFLGAPHFGLDA